VVALADGVENGRVFGRPTEACQLLHPAPGADFGRGVEEELAGSVGENHGAHVPALGDQGGLRTQTALRGEQGLAHHGQDGQPRGPGADSLGAGLGRQRFPVHEQCRRGAVAGKPETDRLQAGTQLVLGQLRRARAQAHGQGPKHGAGIQIGQPQRSGGPTGDGGLARPGRAVDGDDQTGRAVDTSRHGPAPRPGPTGRAYFPRRCRR